MAKPKPRSRKKVGTMKISKKARNASDRILEAVRIANKKDWIDDWEQSYGDKYLFQVIENIIQEAITLKPRRSGQ